MDGGVATEDGDGRPSGDEGAVAVGEQGGGSRVEDDDDELDAEEVSRGEEGRPDEGGKMELLSPARLAKTSRITSGYADEL